MIWRNDDPPHDEAEVQVLSHRVHVARRLHFCQYCRGTIRPGTAYERYALLDANNTFSSVAVHRLGECHDLD